MATCRTSPFQDGDEVFKCHEWRFLTVFDIILFDHLNLLQVLRWWSVDFNSYSLLPIPPILFGTHCLSSIITLSHRGREQSCRWLGIFFLKRGRLINPANNRSRQYKLSCNICVHMTNSRLDHLHTWKILWVGSIARKVPGRSRGGPPRPPPSYF